MLKIWGRRDGSNVVKVMWCIGELGLDHERVDWGGPFGGNDEPAYRAKNPMGRLPTLEEDDGFTLWESGAIVRYLSARHGLGSLCPEDLRARADAEKWMDWSSLYLAKFNTVFLDQFFRLPMEQRNPDIVDAAIADASVLYDILDRQLAGRPYLCGDQLTIADIPAGSLTHRWIDWAPHRPPHPNVEAWYRRLCARPAYRAHVVEACRKKED